VPLIISPKIFIPDQEITLIAVRAQGAGGQHVNKVASAIHLRFDIANSSLPEEVKARLLARNDQRLSDDGVLILKAQQYRTQEKNRADALERLLRIIRQALAVPKKRTATKPTKAARQARLTGKSQRGRVKALRRKVGDE